MTATKEAKPNGKPPAGNWEPQPGVPDPRKANGAKETGQDPERRAPPPTPTPGAALASPGRVHLPGFPDRPTPRGQLLLEAKPTSEDLGKSKETRGSEGDRARSVPAPGAAPEEGLAPHPSRTRDGRAGERQGRKWRTRFKAPTGAHPRLSRPVPGRASRPRSSRPRGRPEVTRPPLRSGPPAQPRGSSHVARPPLSAPRAGPPLPAPRVRPRAPSHGDRKFRAARPDRLRHGREGGLTGRGRRRRPAAPRPAPPPSPRAPHLHCRAPSSCSDSALQPRLRLPPRSLGPRCPSPAQTRRGRFCRQLPPHRPRLARAAVMSCTSLPLPSFWSSLESSAVSTPL
nr:basic salivary proline-rich protein 2-like [Cavia porcellus]